MLLSLLATALLVAPAFCADAAVTQTVWGQCGGRGWNGPTACQTGTYCNRGNEWYSQCVAPGNAAAGASGGGTSGGTSGDVPLDDSGDGSGSGGRVVTRTITTVFSVGPSSAASPTRVRPSRITRLKHRTSRTARPVATTTVTLIPDVPGNMTSSGDDDDDDDDDDDQN